MPRNRPIQPLVRSSGTGVKGVPSLKWAVVEISERACALLLIFAELASADAKAPETHVALGGASSWAQALYALAGALWSRCPDDAAARRWHRDAPLFGVAAAARDKRTQRAWERLAR
jgi:hypothetical protein